MDYLVQLDHSVFHFINQTLTHPWLDVFFPVITDLGKQLWFKVLVYPVLLFLYYKRYQKKGLFLFFMGAFAVGLTDFSGTKLFKHTVERPRPFETSGLEVTKRSNAHGTSFISNHASNMSAFATYTSAFFPEVRIVFWGTALLIAYSRVYNGVHFPVDVICGALWGIAIALLFISLARWCLKRRPFV